MSSSRRRPIGLAIIDDDRRYAEGLAELLLLGDRFDVVGIATEVEAGLALLADATVDLALVDVRMPDGGGLRIVETVRAWPNPPQVVLISAQAPSAAARASGVPFISKDTVEDHDLVALVGGVGDP